MSSIPAAVDTLQKSRRVFERLADEFDRSRLRAATDMRRQVLAALDVVGPALAAQRAIESASLADRRSPRPPDWRQALALAELQRDRIASLVKDVRILASEPGRYRAEHVAALAFELSKALREHLNHEETRLCRSLSGGAGSAAAVEALRCVEAMLGRLR